MARSTVVVVTGLQAEARAVRLHLDQTIAGGGDPIRLERELERALSDGAEAVLSFGLAAGLQAGRRPGTLVIPIEVVSGTARYPTDSRWSERMRDLVGGADAGLIAGVDAPLLRPADKAQLHHSTGAIAADMESHLAARLAQQAARPFAAVRVISDPAERSLPPAAAIGMKPDGSVNAVEVLFCLLRDPRQLPDLVRVAGEARTAMRVLKRCRRALGPDLGWAHSASQV
ncbi:MAG TPA: squalene--hopene cyclase [Burkholderiaceae bacterium]